MTIGREAADITIEDPEISRRHAEVRPAGGGLEVEDLGSTNGTFINEDRIGSATALAGGDTLRVGQAELQLESAPVAGGTVVAGAPAGGTAISQSPSPQEPSAPSGAAEAETQAWQPAPEAETPTAAQPAAGYTPPPASSQPPSEYTPPPAPLRPEGGGYSPPQGGYTPPPAQGAAYTPPPAQQGYSPPQAQQPYQSGPPSYGGAPASKSGGSKTPLIIGLVVALLAITAIVLFVFPGVLKKSDEDAVRDVVASFGQEIDNPDAFCELFTQRFLEEQAGTTGDAAKQACIDSAEEDPQQATEVQINSVDVQGENATVEAEAEGETATFQLEKQDGEWLVDSVE